MDKHKPLTIYKASAGSGKTFQLAVDFISLLVLNPDSYKDILAVTFTNKATDEMKMRILSQLNGLANNYQDSDPYLQKIKEQTCLPTPVIQKNAKIALSLLVHNYNYFRILTIDAFFQSILRNLAHELNLTANLKIGLNDKEIEEEAVDKMIENLEPGQELLKWIQEYIETNINEDRNWNIISKIKEFGNNIFKDIYHKHREELTSLTSTPHWFSNYRKILLSKKVVIQQCITTPYKKILLNIEKDGFDNYELFSYGERSSVLKYIKNRANGLIDNTPTRKRDAEAMADPSKWVKKNTPETTRLTSFAKSYLSSELKSAEENRLSLWKPFISTALTIRHLNQLQLLKSIENAVDEVNRNSNRFQLSNTQDVLREMIDGNDSPFIFEKIGSRLRHIMIDEFQDTSTTQWANFKVLLDNCLSQEGSHSLIVGDVKQSIYRWRSGDWTLLNNMKPDYQTDIKCLSTNYRSEENIVLFNNAFFSKAAEIEAEQLKAQNIPYNEQIISAYSDVEQVPNKKGQHGYVKIELLKKEENVYNNTLQKVKQFIVMLLEKGTAVNDIAILLRTNKDIPAIASALANDEYFATHGINFISDDAFRLDASIAVRLIMSALRVLLNKKDTLAKAELVKYYQCYVLKKILPDSTLLVTTSPFSIEEQNIKLNSFLPDAFTKHLSQLNELSIAELIAQIYDIFSLEQLSNENSYICTFNDFVTDFVLNNSADIGGFIKYWDENLHKISIQNNLTNGIRIITIHKSKGLEFRHVIIPFCDWSLEQNGIIWCQQKKEKPFNILPIIPIDYSTSKLQGSIYESDYQQEHLLNIVDNLNLLYVAFTRAREGLYIIGERHEKTSANKQYRSTLVEKTINAIVVDLKAATIKEEDENLTFTYGHVGTLLQPKKSSVSSQNIFEQKPISKKLKSFKNYINNNLIQFRQSNESLQFSADKEVDNGHTSYIQKGTILHNLLANVQTLNDLAPAIERLKQEGLLDADEQTYKELYDDVNIPIAKEWFDKKWRVFTECSILTKDDKEGPVVERRPDRVITDGKETIVIDYKFGKPLNEHKKQVNQYMQLLKQMGHKNVKGYLWYVPTKQIVNVR